MLVPIARERDVSLSIHRYFAFKVRELAQSLLDGISKPQGKTRPN